MKVVVLTRRAGEALRIIPEGETPEGPETVRVELEQRVTADGRRSGWRLRLHVPDGTTVLREEIA